MKFRLQQARSPIIPYQTRIDRENRRIYGAVAMQSGIPAIGHNRMADVTTLKVLAELGNQAGLIRQHFGHIGLSENGMGKKIGRAYNFRVHGDKLLHDTEYFSPSSISPVFDHDVLEYIFQMAETHPDEIAESVVIWSDSVWILKDGTELDADDSSSWRDQYDRDEKGRPVDAIHELPILRPVRFHCVDLVGDGALTHDGLFAAKLFSDTSGEYAQEAFALLDELQSRYNLTPKDVEQKGRHLLDLYIQKRTGTMSEEQQTPLPQNNAEAEQGSTPEQGTLEPITAQAQPGATEQAGTTEEPSAADQMLQAALQLASSPEPATQANGPSMAERISRLESDNESLVQTVQVLLESVRQMRVQLQELAGEPVVRESVGKPQRMAASTFGQTPPHMDTIPMPQPQQGFGMAGVVANESDDPVMQRMIRNRQRSQFINGG